MGVFWSFVPLFENMDEVNEEFRICYSSKCLRGLLTVRVDELLALFETKRVDECRLPLFPVRADGLAERLFIADDIEHVVAQLEREAEVVGVAGRGLLLLLRAARRGHARDFLAWGYFQSERYFADFAPTIKEELRAKAAPAGPYAAQITAAAYPVCVHLRRGDYQKPENAILQVCTPDYYARAVAAVRDEHPDAALFVFSDDIDWAREHLDTAGLPAVFLPRGEAVADLALMQLCRGFVLSNSTYSWWAQYLAPAPDKQTWAPDKWYAHTKKTALYQDGWQLIKASPKGLRPQARVEA